MVSFSKLVASLGKSFDGSELRWSNRLPQPKAEPDAEEGEVPRAYSGAPAQGIEVICMAGYIETIFLFGHGIDRARYAGELPNGLTFDARPGEVRQLFGVPSASGPALNDPILGHYGAWDRYQFATHTIHFQYTPQNDAIAMVTLTRTPERAP